MMFWSFLTVACSCLCLCFSQNKNFKQIFGGKLSNRLKMQLRVLGFGSLVLSIGLAFYANGFVGLVEWCGLFTLVTIPIAFALPYIATGRRPKV
ncbi:MAG: DUF3325 domain-containing protein [Pseudomonadota bacterium]